MISVVLAGACLGFLPHNFHRARIFMGDSGSMLIGLMLAAASTTAAGPISQSSYGAKDMFVLLSPFLLVIAVMLVPALDALLAIIRRTRAGRSPFSPDKMHLHHRLLQIGHSHRKAVLIIYLWVAIIAFGPPAPYSSSPATPGRWWSVPSASRLSRRSFHCCAVKTPIRLWLPRRTQVRGRNRSCTTKSSRVH